MQKRLYRNRHSLQQLYITLHKLMKEQKTIAALICHLCQNIVKINRSLSCKKCFKTHCFPCIVKYYPSKAAQMLPQNEEAANIRHKLHQCFFCLQLCICDKCKQKGSVLASPLKLANTQCLEVQQQDWGNNPENTEMGLFKGKKFSQMPAFMQRAYLKKKLIYHKHELSNPITNKVPQQVLETQNGLQNASRSSFEEPFSKNDRVCQFNSFSSIQIQPNQRQNQTATLNKNKLIKKKPKGIGLEVPSRIKGQSQRQINQEMIVDEAKQEQMDQQCSVFQESVDAMQNSLSAELEGENRGQSMRNKETIAILRQTFIKRQASKLKRKRMHKEQLKEINDMVQMIE